RYRGKLGTDADEFIEYAVTGVERMHALIKDLLTYSRARTRPLEPETVDLRSVVREAERILQLSITESAAEVTCDWMPTVRVDATQMTQVFQNLLSNAIKFRATVPPRVRISSELLEGVWLISVEDNGVGVAPEHGERIFIIFQRLHGREEYPGTGVGLAICRQIVERHGGRIWVDSRPGGGAVFQFTLPVTNGESPSSPAEHLD
ncbi:MAG: ATP-binding protein, partial [Gemmatimonadota bacterium]